MLKRKMMHGILMLCALVFLSACGEKQQVLEGETMGTYYSIKYVPSSDSPSQSVLQTEIDRILEEVNDQMST
ncbi:FAD:protein FMN transferase ApbE, partial [Escherichia coli]|nr:FAD:protein FMN transferase ApbE [Escherichia coli]